MNDRVQLRKVSGDELDFRNIISRRVPIAVDWLGATWALELSPCQKTREGHFQIEADWGGARIVVRTDEAWVEKVAQTILNAVDVVALPEPLRLAVLESAFAQASTQLENATRKRFRIVAAGMERLDLTGLESFEWQAATNDQTVCGELWVDALGLGFLANALRRQEPVLGQPDEWLSLPVPVRFSIGWVELATGTIAGTVVRDVIMLDETWLRGESGLTVLVGRRSAFRATVKDTTITVTQGIGEIMEDKLEASVYDEEKTLDDISVRLTFDLGERVLTLGELKSLAPGFTFDLGRDLMHAVTIRANGLAIGEGELVEIDGRIGVSVLTLNRFAE